MHCASKTIVRSLALALCTAAAPALAQDCPEGDWFCEPAPEQPAAAPEPSPPSEPAEGAAPPRHERRVALAPERKRPVPSEREPARRLRHRRFGLDVHVFGVILRDADADPDAAMGGVGVGLRYRPIPEFALDGSVELGFGTDYNGYDRREGALLVNGVGFLNPHSIVKAYALAGLGFSVADVESGSEVLPLDAYDEHFRYFGMQLGAGVEVHVSRRTAIHTELIGFVRTRTDRDRDEQPEFIDPVSHRATNTSGGGLVRVGAMFYF